MHRVLHVALGLQFAAIMAFFLAALFVLGVNDFNVGTDVGLHYGFANEIARFGWPLRLQPSTSYLSIMAHYPPASHALALAISLIGVSTLRGIFVVTALSFVVTYLALAELMRRPAGAGTIVTLLAFLLIASLSTTYRFLEGSELIENFFFGQFAATAALLVFSILLFRSKVPFGRWLIAAAVATHVLGWIYTLCAIELALACAAFKALEFLDAPSPRSAAFIVITGLSLCAVAIIHPTMIGSLAIAANDGGISIDGRVELILFMSLIVGTLILLIIRPKNDLVNQSAVIALSVGVAAACAAQYVALKFFGMGSFYAVKKFGFLLGTLDVLIWASLLADVVRRFVPAARSRLPRLVYPIAASSFGVAMLLILTIGFAGVPVSLEEQYAVQVTQLMTEPGSRELDGNTVSWNDRLTPHVNYTVGVGLLHPREALMEQHALFLADPKLTGAARFVLIDAASGLRYDPPCVVAATAVVAAVRSKCWFPQR
jgi:hypothetical protein